MKTKYTVIYTQHWQTGSHWNALTKMKRVEVDCDDTNRLFKLADEVGTEDIQYIFEGWPPMQGEKTVDALEKPDKVHPQ